MHQSPPRRAALKLNHIFATLFIQITAKIWKTPRSRQQTTGVAQLWEWMECQQTYLDKVLILEPAK